MHPVNISADITARALASRGGRKRLFSEINPARTAHLIIDMQNGFMEPGALVEIAAAREVVTTINRLSRVVRKIGALNIFVQFTVDPRSIKEWSTFFGEVFTPEITELMLHTFSPGSHGHALYAGLEIERSDLQVNKSRFGAFVPGTSDLETMLRSRGIDTLIVSGTATNVCCETTAREAMQRNFRVIFVSDATAAITDVEHNAALNSLTAIFAEVVPAETVLEALSAMSKGETRRGDTAPNALAQAP
jgi:ureidoacrylate peracid hydrolase